MDSITRARPCRSRKTAERGFTLLEVVLVVALFALVAGLSCETLATRPAQGSTTATAFAQLVGAARALAAVDDGATIAVVRIGEATVATLYVGRPIAGESPPSLAEHSPPLQTPTDIALLFAGVSHAPPFALFFAASGHASAQAPYALGIDAPLATEPACPLATGIVIAFVDGVQNRTQTLSCEFARLDLGVSTPVPTQSGSNPLAR